MSSISTRNSRLAATTVILAILALGFTAAALAIPASAAAPSVTIVMPQNVGAEQSLNFQPASVTVAPGTTVTFSDQDSQSGAPHNVVWDTMPAGAGVAGSPLVMTFGQTYSVTLTVPGTYTYHCEFHSSWMKGTIIVSAGGATSSTSSLSSTPVVTSTSASTTASTTTRSTTSTTSTAASTTSTSTVSTLSKTSTSTTTTVSDIFAGTYTLQVSSVDQNGAGIFGFHVSVSQLNAPTPTGSTTPTSTVSALPTSSGFTTYTDKLSYGVYQIAVDPSYGGCTFSQWKDSSGSSPTATIRLSANTQLVAVYKCAQSKLQIVTQQADGAALTGYYVTLVSRDGASRNCYSTCSFMVDNGQTYQILVDNFGSESFSHFSDHKGSAYSWGGIYTESVPAGSTSGTITLIAVYTSSHSTSTTTTSSSTSSHTSTTTTTTSSSSRTTSTSTASSTSTSSASSSSRTTSTSTASSTSTTAHTSTTTSATTARTSTTSTSKSTSTAPSTSTSTTTSTTISSTSAPSTGSSGGLTIVMPQNVGADQTLNFSPASVTVAPSTVVTFADQDSQSGAPHDVVWTSVPSGVSPANSPQIMISGQTFTVTLTVPGTYTYHCIFHSWMTATITVS